MFHYLAQISKCYSDQSTNIEVIVSTDVITSLISNAQLEFFIQYAIIT